MSIFISLSYSFYPFYFLVCPSTCLRAQQTCPPKSSHHKAWLSQLSARMFPASMPAAGEALHDILGTVERSQVQGRDPLAG